MAYCIPYYKWVVCHPLYNPKQAGALDHCSPAAMKKRGLDFH